MNDLPAFAAAPPQPQFMERHLREWADLALTGGRSLFEAKRRLHARAHCFPNRADTNHFSAARAGDGAGSLQEQSGIPWQRGGFFGMTDECLDLLAEAAARRPDWQFAMVGSTAQIGPATLQRASSLHRLEQQVYADLSSLLAGWDAGMMPFALNGAMRFISPIKPPEYLAVGVPVVSTATPDVVREWAPSGPVEICSGADELVTGLAAVLAYPRAPWLARVDQVLAGRSWHDIWKAIAELMRPGQVGWRGIGALKQVKARWSRGRDACCQLRSDRLASRVPR